MRTALLVLGSVLACAASPRGSQAYRAEAAPAALAKAVASADAAIAALQKRLGTRLFEELEKGGVLLAVRVCRDEAQSLTAAVAREQGIAVGRTSHRLRNPSNAPPAWAAELVRAAEGKKAADVEAWVVELKDKVGVLRPIPTAGLCTKCHGEAEGLAPELRSFLASRYPEDRAVGFQEGELRGFFWAELAR
jgi:hypothetical protein